MRESYMTSNRKSQDGEESKFYTADLVTPAPGSEDAKPSVVPGSMKPIDIESLPLKHQAILRVLARESEKAEERGEADYTIAREQVDAELKNLRKEKRKSKR
jgi:hypothetical protein